MQLWIAARQNDRVRRWRRLVRKRRKERQLRARIAPIGQDMRIGKSKGLILGHSDALRGRFQSMHRAGKWRQFACDLHQRGQIDARGNAVGHGVYKLIQIRAFPGLHQAEMAGRMDQRLVACDRTKDRHGDAAQGFAQHLLMPGRADIVRDHPGDGDGTIVSGKSADQCADRLPHARRVNHQHDRQSQGSGQIGGRSGAICRPVKQAHHAFDNQKAVVRQQAAKTRVGHREWIEIDALYAAGDMMEPRVNIIRPAFGPVHVYARPFERPQQPQGKRGFASPRCRRGDDQARSGVRWRQVGQAGIHAAHISAIAPEMKTNLARLIWWFPRCSPQIMVALMKDKAKTLRRGWTTGACATAATRAALVGLWSGAVPDKVTIRLPRGEQPEFSVSHHQIGTTWCEAGIIKDAGDDPDVTHGVTVIARVAPSAGGVTFRAGPGIGTITRAGLPLAVGEPAINPVPRQMMTDEVAAVAAEFGQCGDIEITISIPGGEALAQKTWNPRLGIIGGLSVLGTTGIVRPYSCSAWIASIHQGIDVARAAGLTHVAGCTGATSEAAVQAHFGLPDQAMLDMGDFAGGMLKYLARHPVPRVTIGGGIGKITKLAQGALDLHSARSQVDFARLAKLADTPAVARANTALEALEIGGSDLALRVAGAALEHLQTRFAKAADPIRYGIVIVDRQGRIVAEAGP